MVRLLLFVIAFVAGVIGLVHLFNRAWVAAAIGLGVAIVVLIFLAGGLRV